MAFAVTALVGWKDLSQSQAPLALVADRALGNNGNFILSIIALFATSNTCLMMLISGSRIIYGMSKTEREIGHDSSLTSSSTSSTFPRMLGRVHGNRKTPWIAIIITMIIGIIVIISSREHFSSRNIHSLCSCQSFLDCIEDKKTSSQGGFCISD